MDARLLVEPKFMKSERFGLGDVPKEPLVTIAKVKTLPQKGDRGEDETWGLLYFKEPWARPLKVIPTTLRCLLAMFNPEGDYESDRWIGKRLLLYAMPGVFFGKRGTAVRIKGSPDIRQTISVSVKKFGGGSDVYNLQPIGGGGATSAVSSPYTRMWDAWKAAGFSNADAFKALIKAATGKPTTALTEDDMPKFEAALKEKLSAPPPPISDEEAKAIEEKERGIEPGTGG